MKTVMVIILLACAAGSSWAADSDWAPRTQDELYRFRDQHVHEQKLEEKRRRKAEEKRLKAEAEAQREKAYQDCLQARQTDPGLACTR
jgi:hypothetical protein